MALAVRTNNKHVWEAIDQSPNSTIDIWHDRCRPMLDVSTLNALLHVNKAHNQEATVDLPKRLMEHIPLKFLDLLDGPGMLRGAIFIPCFTKENWRFFHNECWKGQKIFITLSQVPAPTFSDHLNRKQYNALKAGGVHVMAFSRQHIFLSPDNCYVVPATVSAVFYKKNLVVSNIYTHDESRVTPQLFDTIQEFVGEEDRPHFDQARAEIMVEHYLTNQVTTSDNSWRAYTHTAKTARLYDEILKEKEGPHKKIAEIIFSYTPPSHVKSLDEMNAQFPGTDSFDTLMQLVGLQFPGGDMGAPPAAAAAAPGAAAPAVDAPAPAIAAAPGSALDDVD